MVSFWAPWSCPPCSKGTGSRTTQALPRDAAWELTLEALGVRVAAGPQSSDCTPAPLPPTMGRD